MRIKVTDKNTIQILQQESIITATEETGSMRLGIFNDIHFKTNCNICYGDSLTFWLRGCYTQKDFSTVDIPSYNQTVKIVKGMKNLCKYYNIPFIVEISITE